MLWCALCAEWILKIKNDLRPELCLLFANICILLLLCRIWRTITPVHVLRDSMGRTVRSLQWRVRMTPALMEGRVRKNSLVATSAAAPQPLPDPTVRRDLTAAATNLVLMVSVCAGHCINKMGFTLKLYITQRYKFCPLLTNLLTNVGFLSFCRTQTERF